MEEHTYIPVAVKYYFDFIRLRPFKLVDCMDALYTTTDADAFADGAELALATLLDRIDKNGMLTNYEVMIIELNGKLSLDEAKYIINANKDDSMENIFKNFKVKKTATAIKEEKKE